MMLRTPAAFTRDTTSGWERSECLVGSLWEVKPEGSDLRKAVRDWPERPIALIPRLADSNLEVIFEDLADQWETETAFESVVIRKALHPAYQRIIGLGSEAVPLILRRLQREPLQWFWALAAITGVNPADGIETAPAAADAWLEWGAEQGLISG